MQRLTVSFLSLLFFIFFSTFTLAESKPNLVLLPLEVSQEEYQFESEYGSALQSGLKERYTVFYGNEVEKELEKEYSKVDCDAEMCQQNVALAFNAELVADASVKKTGSGYILKLVIKNILTKEVIDSPAVPCRGCDELAVVERLRSVGSGNIDHSSVTGQGGSMVRQVATDARAILIFDSEPSGAEVYLDGEQVGQTPYQGLNHRIGDQLVFELRDPGHRPYELRVALNQPITQLEKMKLEPGMASITVVTEPFESDAQIYLDGKSIGKAPLKMDISTLQHEMYAMSGDKKTTVERFRFRDGSSEQIVLRFEQRPAVRSSSISGGAATSTITGIALDFASIPGGRFMMGASEGKNNEKPVHEVTVSPFKMTRTEITQAQWVAVMGDNPSYAVECGLDCPVDGVSWDDVQLFIAKLREATGQAYRLPSEAEWEYAAKSGSTKAYSWGESVGINLANCSGCGSKWDATSLAPVGSFSANAYGLFDMHGNAAEWTQDCWNRTYDNAPNNSQARKSGNCGWRVLRGGDWSSSPEDLRASAREEERSARRTSGNGFRLVSELE